MYKMNKLFTFHISKEEIYAIKVLRKNDINVSRFLRRRLRRFAEKLILKNQRKDHELSEEIEYEYSRK